MKRSKCFWIAGLAFCMLTLAVYGGLYGRIQWDAHHKANTIWKAYPQAQTEVDALLMLVLSDSAAMAERNNAVWVLGRIRAKEALPVLQSYYTGNECQHDCNLCQHELKKAVCRCGGTI